MYPDAWQGLFPGRARRGTDQRTGQNLSGFTAYLAAERAARPFVVDSPAADRLRRGSSGRWKWNEADGQINRFMVPFSAVPNMLKEGLFKYELNAGEVRLTDTAYHPDFAQLNLQYGINNTLTGCGGGIAAENYQAFLLGSGFNLPIGALSGGYHALGCPLRPGYAALPVRATRLTAALFIRPIPFFSLAAYRYSTSGYFSLTDAGAYPELLNRQDITGDLPAVTELPPAQYL